MGIEPLVELVVFVFVAAEAIDDKEKEFSQKTKCFPEKIEKEIEEKKKPKNWGFALIPYQIKEEFLYFH